jgi:hypothetical protein
MRRSIAVVASCVLVVVASATAQTETPEQVAQQYMDAVRSTDWGRAAGLMHPVALQQLRDLLDPLLTLGGAEADGVRQQVFGFTSREAAVAASDSAIFASLLTFTMSQQAGLADAMRSTQFRVLGTVTEGRDTVHVLGRISMTVQGLAVAQMEVVSVMRFGQTWRGLLKGDFAAMASALRAAVQRGR